MSEPTGSATSVAATELRVSSCTMTGQPDPDFAHRPVMADEIVDLFAPVPAGWLVDATLGGAGHAPALLEAHPQLQVLGLDQDPDALAAAGARLERFGDRVRTARARFDRLAAVVAAEVPAGEPVVGVLFDLGVSSPQLDRADRGFSYRLDAPLDMRMDPRRRAQRRRRRERLRRARAGPRPARPTATSASPAASPGPIVAARPVRTTAELAEIVRDAIPAPARRTGGHPGQAHLPGDPHRGQRRARRAAGGPRRPPSTRWPRAAASPCSPTTRARTAS